MRSHTLFRGTIAGLACGVAWMIGLNLFFGPAQVILTDPELQSAKFLAVFADASLPLPEGEGRGEGFPGPRMSEMPWVLPIGLLAIGVLWGWVYAWLAAGWAMPWWKRGLRFAVVSWVLMVPWFEFYLPWNAMREPALLVALEMACWAGVMLCVGLTIAGVEGALRPRIGFK